MAMELHGIILLAYKSISARYMLVATHTHMYISLASWSNQMAVLQRW